MESKWIFKEIEKGFPERDPKESEFFKLTSPAEAVVREFIQNALDAKQNQEIVRVKISFCSRDINSDTINSFLDNTLKEHLNACKFLVDENYPQSVPFLILEDFGTTGLDGSTEPGDGSGNFYNFWWREGISEKMGQRGGRWGLGKTTFHIVSKIKTFWGLTVRNDGKAFLMGKALLKTHSIREKRYHYFGYFSDENFKPINDENIISQFKNIFGIKRNEGDTGLSIVIPMPVEGMDFNTVLKSVMQHYFYPILTGNLKFDIHDENNQVKELNAENLVQQVSSIDWGDTQWKEIIPSVRQILEFIKEIQGQQEVELKITDLDEPEINQDSFEQLDQMKNSFQEKEQLKLRIPLKIKKAGNGDGQETFFTILIKKFPELHKAFEYYIRSGVLISEIRLLGSRPVASLLVAEDLPVCEFLGDCETPAHTKWNERTEGFKEKYENAARILRFIRNSMLQILSILDEPPPERVTDFLKEFFSIPVHGEEKADKERGDTGLSEVPPFERNSEVFKVSSIENGFKVNLDSQIAGERNINPVNAIIRIRMAYDTRRGNPFSQYQKFDFNVEEGNGIQIQAQNCKILSRNLNEIKIEIKDKNFELKVTGFDSSRDLIVEVRSINEDK